jgi:hypothetical protein
MHAVPPENAKEGDAEADSTTEKCSDATSSDPILNGEAPDPFDPERLRLNMAAADVEVETMLTTIPIRKPKRTEFFRVHPAYVVDTYLFEHEPVGQDRTSYLVDPGVQHLLASQLRPSRLFLWMNKLSTVFFWPVTLYPEGDRLHRITSTSLQAADQAKSLWTKIEWKRDLGGYQISRAKGDLGDPQWPEKSLRDLLEIAFRDNRIDRSDHPVLRELDGEL